MPKRLHVTMPGKLRIDITEEGAEVVEADQGQAPTTPSGILEGARRRPYTRPPGGITLYDLGYRKQESGEYAPLDFGRYTFNTSGSADPYPFLREKYNAGVLTAGYLEEDALLRIPQEATYLYIDLVFKQEQEGGAFEERQEIIGEPGLRSYVRDIPARPPSSPPPAPAPPVDVSNWEGAALSLEEGGLWHIRLESGFFYNTFDTADPRFKITEEPVEPETGEPGIEFEGISSTDEVRVLLTPRANWFGHYLDPYPGANVMLNLRLGLFYSLLPDFAPVMDNPFYSVYYTLFTVRLEGNPTLAFWDNGFTYYNSIYISPENDYTISFEGAGANAQELSIRGYLDGIPRPVLVAVIIVNDTPFYVWRVGAGDPATWRDVRINNPTA